MRADNKAFAKVSADNFFILQMATKHLSLNKHFGRQLFQNAQVVAASRYASLYQDRKQYLTSIKVLQF